MPINGFWNIGTASEPEPRGLQHQADATKPPVTLVGLSQSSLGEAWTAATPWVSRNGGSKSGTIGPGTPLAHPDCDSPPFHAEP
jgi:hypothetical protein